MNSIFGFPTKTFQINNPGVGLVLIDLFQDPNGNGYLMGLLNDPNYPNKIFSPNYKHERLVELLQFLIIYFLFLFVFLYSPSKVVKKWHFFSLWYNFETKFGNYIGDKT